MMTAVDAGHKDVVELLVKHGGVFLDYQNKVTSQLMIMDCTSITSFSLFRRAEQHSLLQAG